MQGKNVQLGLYNREVSSIQAYIARVQNRGVPLYIVPSLVNHKIRGGGGGEELGLIEDHIVLNEKHEVRIKFDQTRSIINPTMNF